ncbi:skin secretory protein xP2-like [Panicum virgatum]|uniref:skin secretory protein xP2-like n=1 Tax=Panicum virgatum TaxID=38727 RepID=UPI0019D68D14|nr:skin secretory protein xP2-like [Panicum virgatum]
MPESTEEEEEESSDADLNFSDDDEGAIGAGSPPVYRGAGDEDMPVTLGEARLTSGSLVDPPPAATERRSPAPAAGRRSPPLAVGRRSSTPMTGQRSPPPATGRRTPAPAVLTGGGGGSAASAETPAQTASRRQADPRVAPSGQSSGGVSVPRALRSGLGKRSMSARSGSGAIARDAAQLAPTKALKTGGDAGQSGIVTAAQADAEGEVGRGGANDATRPDVEIEAGRGDADSAAQPVAGGETGGGAQEHPASQREVETLVLEPPRAGVESVTEEGSAPRAPAVEETRAPEPARTEGEGVVATATPQTAPENVVLVVQLPESSDEFGDSRDINPAATASAADRFAQFVSASEEVHSAGMSEGPRHGAIIQSGVPLEFLSNEQEEEAVWKAQIEYGSRVIVTP